MSKTVSFLAAAFVLIAVICSAGCITNDTSGNLVDTITITDAAGRVAVIPANSDNVAVTGSGSSRLIAYLEAVDKLSATDYYDNENKQERATDIRPYAIAYDELYTMANVGSAGGTPDAETLMKISPDYILYSTGVNPQEAVAAADELQAKTGIPVILFVSTDPVMNEELFEENLRMLGTILGKEERAKELLSGIEEIKADLQKRAAESSAKDKTIYVGGVAWKGSHGFDWTAPTYLPYIFLNVPNIAEGASSAGGVQVSKEQIIEWDSDILLVDLATLIAAGGGSIYELTNDPSYNAMTAVQEGEVYAVLPYTSMGTNVETALVDAYYLGTILYPDTFADVNIAEKTDEIFTLFVGENVYDHLNKNVEGLAFTKLDIPKL